jgi:hypothetical protein
MCGDSTVLKDAFSSKGIKDNLLSGGVAWSKDANSELRSETRDALRDKGVIPKKKPGSVDPEAERAAATALATQQANARIAFQRKAMRENSLITGGGAGTLGVG